jgi:hypothetical protein
MLVAVIAAVRTAPLHTALLRGIAIDVLLGAGDRLRYARAVTDRRRVEFVAGRIAARCALAASVGNRVSIAHTRDLAIAAVSDGDIGIDVEHAARQLPSAARELASTLASWLVREAVGKLTGGGLVAPLAGAPAPAMLAAGRWRDHLYCIAYTPRKEDIHGAGSRVQGAHRR